MIFAGGNELGIGKPEVADAPVVELAHLCHNLIGGIDADLLALDHGVDAVAAVVGAASLGLYPHIKVVVLQVVLKSQARSGLDVVDNRRHVFLNREWGPRGSFVCVAAVFTYDIAALVRREIFLLSNRSSKTFSPSPTETMVPFGKSLVPSCS
jgi:hypothetical protein